MLSFPPFRNAAFNLRPLSALWPPTSDTKAAAETNRAGQVVPYSGFWINSIPPTAAKEQTLRDRSFGPIPDSRSRHGNPAGNPEWHHRPAASRGRLLGPLVDDGRRRLQRALVALQLILQNLLHDL